jgi:hypothetical protein
MKSFKLAAAAVLVSLSVSPAHAVFALDPFTQWLYDTWTSIDMNPKSDTASKPKITLSPVDGGNTEIETWSGKLVQTSLDEMLPIYMSSSYNVAYVSPADIDSVDVLGFGDCGTNFKGTGIESNTIGRYGDIAGSVDVYGYRNVLVSYYSDNTGEFLGAKLSTGVPNHKKETVNIWIGDKPGTNWDNPSPKSLMIQCSNLFGGESIGIKVNTKYNYDNGAYVIVLPAVKVVQSNKLYYVMLMKHKGGIRLLEYSELPKSDSHKNTASFDVKTGMLLIPKIVTDDGDKYMVYYTKDGVRFTPAENGEGSMDK